MRTMSELHRDLKDYAKWTREAHNAPSEEIQQHISIFDIDPVMLDEAAEMVRMHAQLCGADMSNF